MAALGTWRNYFSLRKDMDIKGVFWPLYLVFLLWGLWDLIYYPVLSQWFSFASNMIIVLGNLLWLNLALHIKYGKTLTIKS
jgi:hypothetical protein